jgi:hypothetical protein
MENNFGLILLNLVRKNKEKFLGLLRRNGVLLNTNFSNEALTNIILKAMKKSESFKKETVLLMSVLIAESDSSFSNFTNPFAGATTFESDTIFGTNVSTNNVATTTTVAPTTSDKKKFEDTTAGSIFGGLLALGNTFLKSKELDVRKDEAQAVTSITSQPINLPSPTPKKSNTGLYVGLGIVGVAIASVLIYLKTKKK